LILVHFHEFSVLTHLRNDILDLFVYCYI